MYKLKQVSSRVANALSNLAIGCCDGLLNFILTQFLMLQPFVRFYSKAVKQCARSSAPRSRASSHSTSISGYGQELHRHCINELASWAG